jgi:hypothetical protein
MATDTGRTLAIPCKVRAVTGRFQGKEIGLGWQI